MGSGHVVVDYTVRYYDLLLFGVFASMALGAVVGLLTAVAVPTAVTVASLLAIALIGHGLFVNGPVDDPSDLADEVDALNDVPDEHTGVPQWRPGRGYSSSRTTAAAFESVPTRER